MTVKYFNVKTGLITGTITLDAGTGNITGTNLSVTGTSNLGSVSNITITGGSNGQTLTTDGAGNLSWANASSSGNLYITSPMPFYINVGETYYVTANHQGLFTLPITIDGVLQVDGILVEV